MKDSFQTGSLASFLTTVLYVLGAALALLLAVYLHLGRNKKSYAIMRTLGVPSKKACGHIRQQRAEGYVYVLNEAISVGVVIICFVLELLFISLVMFLFQQKMKKTSTLELLQEGMGAAKKTGILRSSFVTAKHGTDIADTVSVSDRVDLAKLIAHESPVHGKYSALRQVSTYILHHMQRGMGKTAVSLLLAVVLAAGIGTFVLAKFAYQDICREMEVKGRAMDFSSDNLMNDASIFEGTGTVCLVGQTLAENLGIRPGDDITLMSESLYSFMPQVYEEEELEAAIERAEIMFKVAGILKFGDADAGIFAAVNSGTEMLFSSQPFLVGYCEFTLSDNTKILETDSLLEELKTESIRYPQTAYYHIDSDLLDNTKRIRDLLVSLFPIVVAAILIGLFGPGLLVLQSAQEAAFLRILGVTKKRARCMLIFEQIFLVIAGIVLVAGILALFSPQRFMRSTQTLAFCWLLYSREQ